MQEEIPDGMMAAAMMASAAHEAEERKRRGHTKLVNGLLKELPPDLMIERLKGVLYRNLAVVEMWQKSEEANAGQDMLAQSMFNMSTAIGEALKWIAIHNGIDPYQPYGDDTYVIRVQDIVLGIDLDDDEEYLVTPQKREYDQRVVEDDDEL
jgi:hypothetical protein